MTVRLINFRITLTAALFLSMAVSPSVFAQPGNNQITNDTEVEQETAPETDSTEADKEEDSGKRKSFRERQKEKDPNRGRILPIPVFITEPAIGDGLGLALAYFHPKKGVSDRDRVASLESISKVSQEQEAPATVTGIFGAYTSNETAAAGVGHVNSFKDDHIRFTGAAAWANVNSTFYIQDNPYKFNLEGVLAYQETRFRFGDSRWFWGIGLSYLSADTAFRVELPDGTPIKLFPNDLKNVGLSGKLAWDSRDNTSMPNSGRLIDLALWRYDDAIGGDFNYWNGRLNLNSFHPFGEKFVLGLRLEYQATSGDAPFFAYPYVKLRGIPALRYQGDRTLVGEIEGRYNFTPKWAMIGFAGSGKVSSDLPIFDTEQSIYSYGLGARYKIFDIQNVWVGIDIARGPEETNWYIQVGQAW
jgi:hypothetical protein